VSDRARVGLNHRPMGRATGLWGCMAMYGEVAFMVPVVVLAAPVLLVLVG
jgi:hypothetical protein